MPSKRLSMYLSAPITKDFIEFAKKRGYATRDELRLYLPMNVTAEELEEVASMLAEMGIAVIGKSETLQEGAGPVTQLRELVRRNAMPPVPAERVPFTPSMYLTEWHCDRCAGRFLGTAPDLHSRYLYRPNNAAQLIPFDAADGWCDACQKIMRIEHAPTPAELSGFKELLLAKSPPTPTFLSYFFRSKNSEADGDAAYKLECARAAIKRQEFRRSPPRCLTCGSDHVIDLSSQRQFTHPRCGGSVRAGPSNSPMIFPSGSDHLHVYDSDCRLLIHFGVPYGTRFHMLTVDQQEQLVTDAIRLKDRRQVALMDLPDISKPPDQQFHADRYRIFFHKDCNSRDEAFKRVRFPRYIYVMLVADSVDVEIVYYVTLERTEAAPIAREFDRKGEGRRIVRDSNRLDPTVFVNESLALIAQRFNVRVADGPVS